MRLSSLVVLGFACALACSSSAVPESPVARFTLSGDDAPTFLDVPFPSDVYRAGGKVIDPVPGLERVVPRNAMYLTHELGKLDGFSRVAHAMFYVDDPSEPLTDDGEIGPATIDPTSLPVDEAGCMADASAVFLIDTQEANPAKARVACRAAVHDDRPFLSSQRPILAVGPARGIVLEEGHTYAAVLTSRVTTMSGKRVVSSDDFAGIVRGTNTGKVAATYRSALDRVHAVLDTALATDGARIVSIAPYTTNAATPELFALRDTLEYSAAPPLTWDAASVAPMAAAKFAQKVAGVLPAGFTASLDDWLGVVDPGAKLPDGSDDGNDDLPVKAHDKIASLGSAVFLANNYLLSKPGGYPTLDHATFARDSSGKIVPAPENPTAKIWVTFAVPTAPMPAGGYPTVIIQHGLSSSRTYLLYLANTFANKGWVVAAIDSVTFGARAADSRFLTDATTNYTGAPGVVYKGPDGFADTYNGSTNGPGDFFGGLLNLGAFRDQLRASAIDTAQLVRVLRSDPDLSPLKTGADIPRLDPARIAYIGDSLGAIEGTVSAAIEPRLSAWTLNVDAGAILLEAGNNSPGIGSLLNAAGTASFGILYAHLSPTHPLINILQTVLEPADPISFAQNLVTRPVPLVGSNTKPRNVLQIEAIYDELLANEGGEALARAAGFGMALPNVGSNAGTQDLKNLEKNRGRVPFANIAPGADGAIRGTPFPGVTAVLVQTSPAEHGSDLVAGTGRRQSRIPYAKWDTKEPFSRLDPADIFRVRQSYREVQGMVTRFFGEAFAGGVPGVAGFKAPIRDFDDDGATDDVDADPSNPNVK